MSNASEFDGFATIPRPKSFVTAWLLSLLLGSFGADRFYLGQIWLGILKLLTSGGFGLWALIDLILILANQLKDSAGNELEGYQQHKITAIVVSIVYTAAGVFFWMVFGAAILAGLALAYNVSPN